MSTSDAGELELRGEAAAAVAETPLCATARPARTAIREHEDEYLERFNHKNNKTNTELPEQNATVVNQEETLKALIVDSLGESNPSVVQVQKFCWVQFHLLDHLQARAEPREHFRPAVQVDGRRSTPDTCLGTVGNCPLQTDLCQAKKEDKIISDVYRELRITTDLIKTHPPNGNCRPHEHNNGLHLSSCVSQPRIYTSSLPGTEAEKDIKHHINFDNLEKLCDPHGNMLSSTMVTVLAAPWSGRLRRTKRFDGTGSSESPADLQDVSNTATKNDHGLQETSSQSALTDGLYCPTFVPLLSTRRNTAGWSAKSDPSSLDLESKRIMTQTVSLDSSGTCPSNTAPSPWSPLLDPNERRTHQTGHQGRISSEPTTSSLLLSLRRVNSNTTNSNTNFIFPEVSKSPLSSSPNDQNGKLTTHLSQTSSAQNEQQRPRPILSHSHIPYGSTETGPVYFPAFSNDREGNAPNVRNNSFTMQAQTVNMIPTSLTSSKHLFQDNRPLERQQSNVGSDKPTPLSDTFLSSARHSSYDQARVLKTHSLPRRTTLTSTSWWKQVSPEGSSHLSHSDTVNTKDKSEADSPCLTDNKRLISQILSSRDNNNTSESVSKGNMNLALKTPESEMLIKQQYSLFADKREPPKAHSMPDCLPTSKLSTAAAQKTPVNTNHPIKKDASGTSLTSNLKELPITAYKHQTSDCSKKYNNSPHKTNSIHTSVHNMDSQTFTKSPLTHDLTTMNSQAPVSGIPTTPNTKNNVSFLSPPDSSKTCINVSTSNTLKFSNIATVTPLGFQRSYACLPKPFRTKTVSSLISQVNSVTKTKSSSVSTTPTTCSSTTADTPPVLSPSVSSAITAPNFTTASSFLTPPATPGTTSPNSETTTPKLKSMFSNSLERESKKQSLRLEGKKERRVTWGDSVDVKCSEPESDSLKAQTNLLSPSRPIQSTPSVFSFLPPGSPKEGTSPVVSPNPNMFSTELVKGEKHPSFSSDSADLAAREHEKSKYKTGDTLNFDLTRQGLSTSKPEEMPSKESGFVKCRFSAPLSLPPDFSSGLNVRYSTPPYSTLMSSRQTQREKFIPHSFSISQSPQSNYSAQTSLSADQHVALTSKPPLSPIRPSQPSLVFQRATATQDCSIGKLSDTDKVNNNHIKDHNQIHSNSQIQLLDNRVHVSSQSLSGDEEHTFSSTCVTETLIYSIKPKVDTATAAQKGTTPKSLQHGTNTLVSMETKSNTMQSTETVRQLYSDQSSNNSKSSESHPCSKDSNSCSMKENVQSKSRFYSIEANNEQSPKKNRFTLKRSASTPNSSVPVSERVNKSYNKMDQMLHRLKQKFSSRRPDEDLTFPWKWKRNSQTPSVSGSSDMSCVSDNSLDSTKTLEEQGQEKEMVLNHVSANIDNTKTLSENRYAIIPALDVGEPKVENELAATQAFSQGAYLEQASKVHLTVHSPTDLDPTNHLAPGSDPNADRSPSPTSYQTLCRRSTPSPRSPFSPFSSISPLSPFPSPDGADDSVFYSPKLQRRRESSSPCDPRERISLGSSRRSRASIGPPSISPVQDKEYVASSYADLKYGIEPGRSFSVGSVLSGRSSRPGRISTGSRFMSVGDLSQSTLSCAGHGKELYQGSLPPDWTGDFHCQPTNDCRISNFFGDTSNTRSRSLPRSWTRLMTSWNSGVPPSQSVTASTAKPALLHSPTMNTCQSAWDTEGPPTPPLTPPLSPVTRRMSKPPSLSSSPTFSPVQQGDIQPSQRHLPSRRYVSSLSTFDESTDSGSDTTTDDEYYLESDDEVGKETEL
ncbi:serine-rich adhesin for platelets [Nothobranchius furzeri]|uniref:serine-rich adhesin for platelets n=1 Tax=Nothobranchius furzeri TaxID=105023 RepID=UPI003904C53E